jgi:hypothetical protein
MRVIVKFSTLGGRQELSWSLEEALASDLAQYVRSLLADRAAVGCTIQHSFYGRVEISLEGKA